MKKLVCIDLDGTLLDDNKRISQQDLIAIRRLNNKGIPIILASARMPKSIIKYHNLLELQAPLIGFNGCIVENKNRQILLSYEINKNVLIAAFKIALEYDINLNIYTNNHWFASKNNSFTAFEKFSTKVTPIIDTPTNLQKRLHLRNMNVYKIIFIAKENVIDVIEKRIEKLNDYSSVFMFRTIGTYLELTSNSISKEKALSFILKTKYKSLSLKDVVAFGDNINDIGLIKSVGVGIAMGNSKKELLKVADIITLSNNESGVAKGLENLEFRL